jgi:hypothetical protein
MATPTSSTASTPRPAPAACGSRSWSLVVHVLEYLWRAAWCFYREGDPAAEQWVCTHAHQVLAGRAHIVAAAIRRKATYHRLGPSQRRHADTAAASYLLAKKPYLDYPTALAEGWPIATGVIEGACRHLVKDRMDITGARWGLAGAEAILKLRALTTNGDFDAYWRSTSTRNDTASTTPATSAVSSQPGRHPHESRTRIECCRGPSDRAYAPWWSAPACPTRAASPACR